MAEENNQDNQYIIELIEGNKLSKKKKFNIYYFDSPTSEINLDFSTQFENQSNFTIFKNFKEYTICVFTQTIDFESQVTINYINLYIFDNTFNSNKMIKIPFPLLNNKIITKKKNENKNFINVIYESIDEKNGFLFLVIVNEAFILNLYKNDEGDIKYKKIFQNNKKKDLNTKNNIIYLSHNINYDKKILEFVTIIKPINIFTIYIINYNDDYKVEIQNYNLEEQYRNKLQLNRFYTSKSEYYLFCENNNIPYILYKNINKQEFKVKRIILENYPEINLLKKPFSIIQNKKTKNLILYTETNNKTNNIICQIGVYELSIDLNIIKVQKLQEINLIAENFKLQFQYFPNHNYIYFSDKHFLFFITDENSNLIKQIYKIKISDDKSYFKFDINNYNNNIIILFYNINQQFDILLYEMKIENENNNDKDNDDDYENINEKKIEIEKLFYNDKEENEEKKMEMKIQNSLNLNLEIDKIINQKIEIYQKKLNYLFTNYKRIEQNQFNNIQIISNLEKKLLEIKQIQINKNEQILNQNNINFQNNINQLFNQNQELNQEIYLNKSSSSQSSNEQN